LIKSVFLSTLLLALFTPNLSFGASFRTIVLENYHEKIVIGTNIQYLEDIDGELTINDILEGNVIWNQSQADKLNFGYTPSVYWMRFSISNASSFVEDWILDIENFFIDEAMLYIPANDGFDIKAAGYDYPISHKEIRHRNIVFYLNPAVNKEIIYYVRFRSEATMNLPISVRRRDTFFIWAHNENFIWGIFFGIVFIMVIYNLIFSFFIKEPSYLHYVLGIGSYLIYMLFIKGIVYEYFSDIAPFLFKGFFRGLGPLFGAVGMFWGIKFTQSFLFTKEKAPVVHKVLNIVLIPTIIFMISSITLPYRVTAVIGNSTAVIWAIAVIFTSIFLAAKGNDNAKFFLVVHGLLVIGVTLHSLRALGVLPHTFITNYGNQIGFALSAVVLSVGLANSFHRMRLEKEQAQAEGLEYLKRVKELQDTFVEYLEAKVEERTEKLNTAYETLKHKDMLLRQDLSLASKLQESLLPKKAGSFGRLNITVKYLPMDEVGGDLYDIFEVKSGVYRLFLADATGHGVQAALATMLMKSEYESVKKVIIHPSEALELLNSIFLSTYSQLPFFFTCIVLDIDLERGKIKYASAGHPKQLIFSKHGIKEIQSTGGPIGITEDASFDMKEIDFRKDDRILLFSDGIYEQFNLKEREFGYGRMREFVEVNKNFAINRLVDMLIEEVTCFIGEAEKNDDITVIAVEQRV